MMKLNTFFFIAVISIMDLMGQSTDTCIISKNYYAFKLFENTHCVSFANDTISDLHLLNNVDTLIANRQEFLFKSNNLNFLYYSKDTMSQWLSNSLGNGKNQLILFDKNGKIQELTTTDGCIENRLFFYYEDDLVVYFYCDHSNPINCFEKKIKKGKLIEYSIFSPDKFVNKDNLIQYVFNKAYGVCLIESTEYFENGEIMRYKKYYNK